ncbi:MAG: hypothetical protein M0T84_17650 [Betaproteobacteria bacterium]|nr:hypothetical protein [Betaproteobacteria bacterium]
MKTRLMLFLLLALVPLCSHAAPPIDPLRIGTIMHFGPDIRTVGEAAQSILQPTGFQLVLPSEDPSDTVAILDAPLPPEAQDAGLMSVKAGLLRLIGRRNRLVVDPRHKLVAFEPKRHSMAKNLRAARAVSGAFVLQ